MRGGCVGIDLQPSFVVTFLPRLLSLEVSTVAVAVAALRRLSAFLWWKGRDCRATPLATYEPRDLQTASVCEQSIKVVLR